MPMSGATGPRPRSNAAEGGIAERGHDLARAVGAEVEAEDPVAFGEPGIAADDRGLDELVGGAGGVGGAHGLGRRVEGRALAVRHGAVGARDAVPAVVAVHRPVAADDGGDGGAPGQGARQLVQEGGRGGGSDIAAVGDRVDVDAQPFGGQRLGGGDDVRLVPVHPAVRDHAHQVRGAALALDLPGEGGESRVAGEAAVLDGEVDAAEVHGDDAPGADVGVPDLGVAHLPGGQADIGAVGDQAWRAGRSPSARPSPGSARGGGALPASSSGQAPAVEDGQDHGVGSSRVSGLAPDGLGGAARPRQPGGTTRRRVTSDLTGQR